MICTFLLLYFTPSPNSSCNLDSSLVKIWVCFNSCFWCSHDLLSSLNDILEDSFLSLIWIGFVFNFFADLWGWQHRRGCRKFRNLHYCLFSNVVRNRTLEFPLVQLELWWDASSDYQVILITYNRECHCIVAHHKLIFLKSHSSYIIATGTQKQNFDKRQFTFYFTCQYLTSLNAHCILWFAPIGYGPRRATCLWWMTFKPSTTTQW